MIMRLIDIFNLISEGKCPPKKIKYKGSIYTYLEQEEHKIYQYEDYNAVLDIQCFENLNDEVEIFTPTANNIREYIGLPRIEEKKIPEKIDLPKKIEIGGCNVKIGSLGFVPIENVVIGVTLSKINDIIDYLDYLKSKGDE